MRDQAKALEDLCRSRLRTVKKIAEDGMREPMLAYQPQEVFALDTRCRYQMGNSQRRYSSWRRATKTDRLRHRKGSLRSDPVFWKFQVVAPARNTARRLCV